MTSFKEKSRNRFDVFVSMLLMLFLFWMPMYVAATMGGSSVRQEYRAYGQAWRVLCIIFFTGEYMDTKVVGSIVDDYSE